jgi:peptide/nickel transport system substrate-binding protein
MFKTFRRYYWVTQSFLQRHLKIIVQTTVIVLSLILIFFIFAKYIPSPKQTTRIGRIGKYNSETFPQDIQAMISRGLVSMSEDGKILPDLAESWEIQDGGNAYVFKLRDDIYWHDGTKLTSEDISYNFKDVDVIREDGTISYKLKEPFAPFLSAVTKPILKKNKLGTGDYKLVKTQVYTGVLQSMILETDSKRIIYKFYPTETSSLTAYSLGEIDKIENISTVPESIKKDKTSEIVEVNTKGDQQAVLFFNNNDTVLTSKQARQALAYAIEDKSFGKERAISPIKESSWAFNDLVKTYDFDPDKAKTLLAQDIKDPKNIKLELKTMLQYLDYAESIAESWRKTLGVEVEVKVVSNVTSDYQILLADFTPPLDPDQYSIWHSTQNTNFTHSSNLKIDKLLEDGRRTSDQKLRKEIYQDFQRFLLEDSPAVFLFKSATYTINRVTLL